MKILALSYYFPPLAYPQSIQIGRLLQHSRCKVEVYCANERGPKDPSMLEERRPELTVHRLPWSARAKALWQIRRFTLRYRMTLPDVYRRWADEAASTILKTHRFEPDAVLVTFGQPMSDHLAGKKIKRATGLPWIAHFSDPWVDNPFRQETSIVRSINRRLERSVLETADAVVFTSEETAQLVMSHYLPALGNKVRVIPHAYDPNMYSLEDRSGHEDSLVVRYIGNFYGPRTPMPLYQGLQILNQRDPSTISRLRVELIGTGPRRMRRSLINGALPQGLVSVLPPVNYSESLGLMKTADVLLVIDAPGDASPFLPSKLIDYVGAKRPIVAITPPGPAARIVGQMGGWVADPRYPSKVADALRAAIAFAGENPSRAWGDPELRTRYTATTVSGEFDAFVQDVAAGTSG